MYYLIYKITNIINEKIYIGKHQTQDINDDYMGSGKLLKRAILKYGIQNFKKEILFLLNNEQEMNEKEKELVNTEFLSSENTYNLCPGGHGGFGYINKNGLNLYGANVRNLEIHRKRGREILANKILYDKNYRQKYTENVSKSLKEYYKTHEGTFKGKKHTEETKKIISEKRKGTGKGIENSQAGSFWVTNGIENKKIKKDGIIPDGFFKGRCIKPK